MASFKSREVEQRIRDGEQFTTQDLAKEYFPDDDYFLVGRQRVHSMVYTIQKRLAAEQIVVCQTADGYFGIPQNKSQVEYGMKVYKRRIDTNVMMSLMLHAYSRSNNILPDGMRNKTITLPVFGT